MMFNPQAIYVKLSTHYCFFAPLLFKRVLQFYMMHSLIIKPAFQTSLQISKLTEDRVITGSPWSKDQKHTTAQPELISIESGVYY